MYVIILNQKMTKNPFTIPLPEYYKEHTQEQLINKLMDKNKLIETAEKEIVSLETEIKELNKDLDEEKQIRVTLYKEVKVKNAEIELVKKNFSIEREQHQIDIMKKDHEITKLKK